MNSIWNNIVHPQSGKVLQIHSKDGQILLREYVKCILAAHQTGGSTDVYTLTETDVEPKTFTFNKKNQPSAQFEVHTLKSASAGLSGDKVFLCTHKKLGSSDGKNAILKVFQKEEDYSDELAAIEIASEKGLKVHFPDVYENGKITQAHRLFNKPQRERYFIVSNRINGISIQNLLISLCESNPIPSFGTPPGTPPVQFQKENVREIVLQLFYILYKLKLQNAAYNHCDFHADNIFISFDETSGFEEKTIRDPFTTTHQPITIPESIFVLKVIDLDTMTAVRHFIGKTLICSKKNMLNVKSSFSGRAKIVKKSLELLHKCQSSQSSFRNVDIIKRYTMGDAVSGHPLRRMTEAATNPSDGDMWHFFFIVVLFSEYYDSESETFRINIYKNILTNVKNFAQKKLPSTKVKLENYYRNLLHSIYQDLKQLFPVLNITAS